MVSWCEQKMKNGQDQRFVWSCVCFKKSHTLEDYNHGGLVQIIFLSKWVMPVGSQPFIFPGFLLLWGSCRRKTSRTSCRRKDLISRPWCMRVLNCFSDGWNRIAVILVLMFVFFCFGDQLLQGSCKIQGFFFQVCQSFFCVTQVFSRGRIKDKKESGGTRSVRKWAADTPEPQLLWFGWCVVSCSLFPSWPQTLLQNQRSWCFVLINLDINVLISRAVGNLIFQTCSDLKNACKLI